MRVTADVSLDSSAEPLAGAGVVFRRPDGNEDWSEVGWDLFH